MWTNYLKLQNLLPVYKKHESMSVVHVSGEDEIHELFFFLTPFFPTKGNRNFCCLVCIGR